MTITIETIRNERLQREATARRIASTIAPGEHYADGNTVRRHGDRLIVATCANHSEACAVMLAIPRV
jgi:hypothetical protein